MGSFLSALPWPLGGAIMWQIAYRYLPLRSHPLVWDWLSICAVGGVVFAFFRDWGPLAAYGVNAVAALIVWWWRSGKRKRAQAMLGAKSKALRDALVRKAREAAKPKPVLRPVPGGVR